MRMIKYGSLEVLLLVILFPDAISGYNITNRRYKSDIMPGNSWSSFVYKTTSFSGTESKLLSPVLCGAQCDIESYNCTAYVVQKTTSSCHLASATQSTFLAAQPDEELFMRTEGKLCNGDMD